MNQDGYWVIVKFGNSEISEFQTITKLTCEIRQEKSRWVQVENYLIGHKQVNSSP